MTKGKFIIYGKDIEKKDIFRTMDGFIQQNGSLWLGVYKVIEDGKFLWSVSVLSIGLRYKLYPTRKKAEEAMKSESTLSEILSVIKNNKHFDELQEKIKTAYENTDDPELAKTYHKMYGEVW